MSFFFLIDSTIEAAFGVFRDGVDGRLVGIDEEVGELVEELENPKKKKK